MLADSGRYLHLLICIHPVWGFHASTGLGLYDVVPKCCNNWVIVGHWVIWDCCVPLKPPGVPACSAGLAVLGSGAWGPLGQSMILLVMCSGLFLIFAVLLLWWLSVKEEVKEESLAGAQVPPTAEPLPFCCFQEASCMIQRGPSLARLILLVFWACVTGPCWCGVGRETGVRQTADVLFLHYWASGPVYFPYFAFLVFAIVIS